MIRLFLFALLLAPGSVYAWSSSQSLAWDEAGEVAAPNVVWDATRQRYVLSWYRPLEGGCHALLVATVDEQGGLSEPVQVDDGCDWFVNWADTPSLAVADNGDWLTFFLRRTEGDYGYDMVMRRSTDGGLSWSTPFMPHPEGSNVQHGFVAMAPHADDRILAVWLDGRDSGAGAAASMSDPMSLRSAVIGRDAEITEQNVLDQRTCSCCQTALARTAPGEHMVAYRDRSEEEIRDIAWMRHQAGADGWGEARLVHADNWQIHGCPVNGPALDSQSSGTAVLWPTMGLSGLSVRFRPLLPAGTMVELEAGAGVGGRVDLAAFGGHWLASWMGPGEGSAASLRLAELSAEGDTLQRESMASLPASRAAGVPRLASADGHALLIWTEPVAKDGGRRRPYLRGALVQSGR